MTLPRFPARPLLRQPFTALVVGCVMGTSVGVVAQVPPQDTTEAAARIYTRAQVRSLPSAQAGEASLLRLKIVPRSKIPFSTLAFEVHDPALLQGLVVGDDVAFRAERLEGRNVVIALRKVAPCVRFQPCPDITD